VVGGSNIIWYLLMIVGNFCSPDKPPVEELQYFLDFQVPLVWAPVPPGIAGQNRKEPVCPSLQFSLMGPKLFVSTEQVKGALRFKYTLTTTDRLT
jgi:hypothetical protein